MRWLALVMVLLYPGILLAQTFPAFYYVIGLEEDEALNVRQAPDASTTSLATLTPFARNIEVIALDESGEWGWVNTVDASGWIDMQYVERQPAPGNSLLPRPLLCFGIDPFWSLDIGNSPVAELNLPDLPSRQFLSVETIGSKNRPDHYAVLSESRGTKLRGVIRRTICSDAASDRIYGLELDLLIRDDVNTQFFSGCCTISPQID